MLFRLNIHFFQPIIFTQCERCVLSVRYGLGKTKVDSSYNINVHIFARKIKTNRFVFINKYN